MAYLVDWPWGTVTGGRFVGLEPLVRLAERCGLPGLLAERVHLPTSQDGVGAFPAAKVMALIGGMAAGADSIDVGSRRWPGN
ncbi:hypothetical protein ACFSL4_30515 [Streptomyces caeni]|uniref:Uncharacterized protein n=1 Tax=Streptomyces caeni TaxID=2307231 RepID=A0ABW4IYF6_9ACTN